MNRPIVIIGVVVLIIGVVLIAVGAVGVLRGLTVITTFSEPQSGEYVSTELMLNSTSGVAVTSAAANGGLIPAQDLNLVNSTNIGQYALTPHSNVAGTRDLHKPHGRLLLRSFRIISTEFKDSRHSTPRGYIRV